MTPGNEQKDSGNRVQGENRQLRYELLRTDSLIPALILFGLSACSGGGGGGSSAPEVAPSVPTNTVPASATSEIMITPPASPTSLPADPASVQTPAQHQAPHPTQVELTGVSFVIENPLARKSFLSVSPQPENAELTGEGFSWTDGTGAGRVSWVTRLGVASKYWFYCAEDFYGDVTITLTVQRTTIQSSVTVTCQ